MCQARRENGRQVFLKRKRVLWAGVFIAAAGIYFGFAAYYHSRFLPSSVFNGLSVAGKSRGETERMIAEEIDGYSLLLKERGGKEESVKGTDIGLKPEFGDGVLRLISRQNEFLWPLALFKSQELERETVVSFDEKKLKKQAEKLSCMQEKNQEEPKNARCSDYSPDGYRIIAEEQGSKIDKKRMLDALAEAVGNLKESISLEDEGCYVKPSVTADNKTLAGLADTLNKYAGTVITYEVGDRKETLDGGVIHQWLEIKNMRAHISEEAVEEYVDGLASSYNTAFRKHTLKTSYGTTVEIMNGDYGWKVDKEGEKEHILKDIEAGRKVSREIVYAQRASSHGENDYGDTYVEINLTAQHLFFYKDGVLVVESDFVSGNLSKQYDTPTGIYALTYKEKDAVLRGENYASPVSYWMPFCNNVGMHDASWRSRFGGGIYKTSGSHGCVNLPADAAKKIFEQIEEGDAVLVYALSGTESAAAAAQDAAQVAAMIDGIGEVRLESEPAIAMARKMYNLLSETGQAMVANYNVLMAAEAQLAALKGQASGQEGNPAEGAPM